MHLRHLPCRPHNGASDRRVTAFPKENYNGPRPYPHAESFADHADSDAATDNASAEAAGVMLAALLIFAVLCGCAGAWRGNRTSWALLASAGLSSAFIWLGVPFVSPVWMMIDLAVVAVVVVRPLKASDCLVMALFVGAWPLYPSVERGDARASDLVNLIVAAQFLLTAPWRWTLHRLNLRPADLHAEGDFLRVRHA